MRLKGLGSTMKIMAKDVCMISRGTGMVTERQWS